ncbi:hypothetical protein NP233_g3285 [Leucocoprinus birnbaumii]|uniref:Acetyl-CoA hydrolase n=1 Tax=Leucocoprinus birnbaumii TaxID=56174 RepID=A0AAD5VWU7_9AGAR|nr:hypothetical protein NP233_g3285 [Leucocoprinus birnbaumii]
MSVNDNYTVSSCFTDVGCPKIAPTVIANHVGFNDFQASPSTRDKRNLNPCALIKPEEEDQGARFDMTTRNLHQVGKGISKGINAGRINFADKHILSAYIMPLYWKPLDWAIIEATAVTEEGYTVPGASVGATPEIVQSAEKLIAEVNTRIPSIHSFTPPNRQPYVVTHTQDRIDLTAIPIGPDRVVALIEFTKPDNTGTIAPENDSSRAIARHLIEFLSEEVDSGRLPKSLLSLQRGIGNVADSIIGGLAEGPFKQVRVWIKVLQVSYDLVCGFERGLRDLPIDTILRCFDSGKLAFATATSIRFSPEGFDQFCENWATYKDRLLLRSQQVANSPEIIRRLGVPAMNTPLEYGHGNSTYALSSRMLNGIGGSADFLRNAKLSIMLTPSNRLTKTDPTRISCIAPFASHVDQPEHDLDVVSTEHGLADLRGLAPCERAPHIIKKCAHPDYRDVARGYYDQALHECLARATGTTYAEECGEDAYWVVGEGYYEGGQVGSRFGVAV